MATIILEDALDVAALTEASVDGTGAFDVLMRATKEHLEQEYAKNRIKGTEYATVYLGSLESTLRTALEFLLQRERMKLDAALIAQQVLLTEAQVAHTQAQVEIAHVQKDIALAELEIALANAEKIPAEVALLESQAAMTDQQRENLSAELLNIPKAGQKLDADVALTIQNTENAVIEGTVLQAQKCKLDAEYDVLLQQKLKVVQETSLLAQKLATEKAQTVELGVDDNSVLGRQKLLYKAQTDGFTRDAEQKAAKLMVDSWSVRRTTDEATQANTDNKLDDTTVGRAVNKLLAGVGA